MNIKKILFTAFLALGSLVANAQETEYEFLRHWYMQAQVGGQYTTGEHKFTKLLSPNAQIAAGYQFTPVWGLRMNVNAWQSKGGSNFRINGTPLDKTWKWNYAAPAVNATMDLTNLIGGFNPNRLVSVGLFAGIGANVAFNNAEAHDVSEYIKSAISTANGVPAAAGPSVGMEYLWGEPICKDVHARFLGQVGANLDFRCSDRVKVGVEGQFNMLNDKYNSKNAPGKMDYYWNALVGVKVALGKTYTTRTKAKSASAQDNTGTLNRIVERVVHDTVYITKEVKVPVEVEKAREPLRRDIFFLICGSQISTDEMKKVDEVAAYLKKYPDATVTVTGYADSGTGNAKGNMKYSQKRAEVVANTLQTKYGIPASRMKVDWKGDTVQPYGNTPKDRVTICIAQ